MKILGFDTAMGACSAAVWADGAITAHKLRPLERGHAEALVPMLEEVRAAAGFEYRDFDCFAVTVGPGTFTGIRVGLATARGFGLATGRPVIGVTTLEVLARAAMEHEEPDCDTTLAVIDARRDEVYAQAFGSGGTALWPPAILAVDDVAGKLAPGGIHLAGTGAKAVAARLDEAGHPYSLAGDSICTYPDAAQVVSLAVERAGSDPKGEWPAPVPLYLRAPDARLPGERR